MCARCADAVNLSTNGPTALGIGALWLLTLGGRAACLLLQLAVRLEELQGKERYGEQASRQQEWGGEGC